MLLVLDFDGVCVRGLGEGAGHSAGETITLADMQRARVQEVVDAAHAHGLAVVVLSNEIDPSWIDQIPVLQTVDHVLACSDNGILKPDRRAFQRCLLKTGAEATRTVVVDDHPDNITVAASLGMTAILFGTTDVDASWDATLAAIRQVANPASTPGNES